MSRGTLFPLSFVVICYLTGCAYQPALETPRVQIPTYEKTPAANALSLQQYPAGNWWQGYGSGELNRLFEELHRNSLDLATARQRVEKARALLGQQRANNWPALDLQLNHRTSHNLDDALTDQGNNLNFSAAYEVDLWGSRSAANYSAAISLIAQQQEYHSQLLQLQATLAQSYFEYLALRDRHAIAEQNLQASKELLDVIQWRFEAGSASGIELNQQRNTYLSTQGQLLDLQRALVSSERAMAVLLGRENLIVTELTMPFSDVQLPPVSLVQPAALLEYRPDIQLAESQLRLNEATLYQQQKKRWPSLNLSAGLGLEDILDSGEGWTSSLIGSLAMPLFDAGNIRQQINATEADLSIAQINYRQVVIQAMRETLETLSELEYQQHLLAVRKQELENNQRLYDLAKLRYDAGDTDFINLLTAQRSWFNARDNLIQARNTQLLATVNVFRAMGIAPDMAPDVSH